MGSDYAQWTKSCQKNLEQLSTVFISLPGHRDLLHMATAIWWVPRPVERLSADPFTSSTSQKNIASLIYSRQRWWAALFDGPHRSKHSKRVPTNHMSFWFILFRCEEYRKINNHCCLLPGWCVETFVSGHPISHLSCSAALERMVG